MVLCNSVSSDHNNDYVKEMRVRRGARGKRWRVWYMIIDMCHDHRYANSWYWDDEDESVAVHII